MSSGPQPAVPRDANAKAEETIVATVGGWRFIGMGGVPLITRRAGGPADSKRRMFLDGLAPLRAGVCLPLDFFAREMGRLWDKALPPDYPAAFRPDPPPGTAPPDLRAALVVLIRIGLLAVEGILIDAVTRTQFQPSHLGYLFIRNEEGLAPRIYWPNDVNSGVTVGPGYDMGGRSSERISRDLSAIGVSAALSKVMAQAAGLTGEQAGRFVRDHRDLIRLTPAQQQQLFDLIVPSYEELVRTTTPRSLLPRLLQHEFDPLLSLAWNLRRYGRYNFSFDVAQLDMVKADPSIKTLTGGGPGIMGRRIRETMMFTDSIYQVKAMTYRNDDLDFQDDLSRGATGNG